MRQTGIEKVMNVWESSNKIISPNKKKQLLDIVDQISSPFSAGEYYYFVFNLYPYKLELVSDSIFAVLGIPAEEFSLEKFFQTLHPEDLEKLNEKEKFVFEFLLNNVSTEDMPLYKVVYLMRLRHTNGEYRTILHQSRALNISKDGKIQHSICVHTDITHLNIPFDNKISFIGNGRPSYFSLDTDEEFKLVDNNYNNLFTVREHEILILLSKGMNVNEIADELFISPHTITTHKKNILRKSECNNTAELIARCIREGII
jgi:DNA-binding CsgD family transcriptional regulator